MNLVKWKKRKTISAGDESRIINCFILERAIKTEIMFCRISINCWRLIN